MGSLNAFKGILSIVGNHLPFFLVAGELPHLCFGCQRVEREQWQCLFAVVFDHFEIGLHLPAWRRSCQVRGWIGLYSLRMHCRRCLMTVMRS